MNPNDYAYVIIVLLLAMMSLDGALAAYAVVVRLVRRAAGQSE